MSRHPVEAPPRAYHHRFVVSAEHIDELGHAGNVTWVGWINEAAIAHSSAAGLGPDEYLRLGVVWVVRRHEVEYLVPALEGEELVAITWVDDLRGATSLRRTLFRRAADDRLMVRAATTWALVETASGKPRRIPRDLMARYGFEGQRRQVASAASSADRR